MAVFINPHNKRLTFELSDEGSINQADRYTKLYSSCLFLLKTQEESCIDPSVTYELLNFLEEILPSCEQIERMLLEPEQMIKEVKQLKREKIELREQLRVLKEKEAI